MTRAEYKKNKSIMDAWANGAAIEFLDIEGKWQAISGDPKWFDNLEYRIKPATSRDSTIFKRNYIIKTIYNRENKETTFEGLYYINDEGIGTKCYTYFKLSDVSLCDRELVKLGAKFIFESFYETTPAGQRCRVTQLVFENTNVKGDAAAPIKQCVEARDICVQHNSFLGW